MAGDDIIIVKPDRKNNILTDEQIAYIQLVLEKSCIDDTCIPKRTLYEAIKKKLQLKLELYQFEQAITRAIRTGKILNFKIRAGRNGGIGKASVIQGIKNK